MKQEFKLLKVIIADYTPEEYDYEPEDANRKAKKSDYESTEVIPVSDPNAATMAQKIITYQAVLQLAQQAPQLYDLALLHRQMIEVLGVKNADKLVKTEEDAEPTDPIQENQDVLTGKPVKAFMEQNHQAHIAVHMAAVQDPKIQQLMQMNPQAQAIMAAAMAHVNEHVAFEYRRTMEEAMGMVLPGEEEDGKKKRVPTEMADQIAIKAAQASQQLLQQHQQEAQQQAAQQKMQDPIVQMQMQELQLKQQDLQLKAQKQATDAASKADQLEIEKSRIEAQMQIAAMQVSATAAGKKDQLTRQQETDGARIGADLAKHRAQMAIQNQQRQQQNKKGAK
jgi:hypothetical protein